MMPLFDKSGELHYIRDNNNELVINSLKNQYRNEMELLALLNLIATLEKVGLM